jgi:hypothetical protein
METQTVLMKGESLAGNLARRTVFSTVDERERDLGLLMIEIEGVIDGTSLGFLLGMMLGTKLSLCEAWTGTESHISGSRRRRW